ncbi:cadherin-like domain-containing protein, partial [Psychromarinibacter halotolerans]
MDGYSVGDDFVLGAPLSLEVSDDSNTSPIGINDILSTDEDSPLVGNVLADNGFGADFDPDGDSLTVSLSSDPLNGSVTLNPDGSFIYTPDANFSGGDSFNYLVDDGNGGTDIAIVAVIVNSVNDDPAAADDSYVTDEDTSLVISLPGVLANDTDVDGDPLSSIVETGPSNGSLTLNPDGSFTYTPDANFNGSDSFTYLVDDGNGGTDSATVTLTVNAVNDDPVATDDSYVTDEDTSLVISLPGVLANDTDIDGDTLSSIVATGPSNGTLSLNPDGSFTYDPDADFNGTDSFTYLVDDGNGGTDTATVSLTVNAVNDDPVAVDDSYVTDEDTSLVISLPGVLANDTDIDGDTLSSVVATGPSNGTLSLNPDGSFTYTP